MIIFIEEGRLGNQLFQYAGLKALFSRHNLLLFGFDSLVSVCDVRGVTVVSRRTLRHRLIFRATSEVLRISERLRLVTVLDETQNECEHQFLRQSGVSGTRVMIVRGFFQHRDVVRAFQEELSIRTDLRVRAEARLRQLFGRNFEERRVFVHVRRGDYVRWPSREAPAVLPGAWYKAAVGEIEKHFGSVRLLICSDDLPYAREVFGDNCEAVFADSDEEVEFAMMTMCSGGVLSASSYSWWASYFCRKYCHSPRGEPIFVAPLFWAGHRKGRWHPEGLNSEWITYLPVWNSAVEEGKAS